MHRATHRTCRFRARIQPKPGPYKVSLPSSAASRSQLFDGVKQNKKAFSSFQLFRYLIRSLFGLRRPGICCGAVGEGGAVQHSADRARHPGNSQQPIANANEARRPEN